LIEAERLKGKGVGKYKGVKQVGFLHSLAVKKLEDYKKELERKGYHCGDNGPIFITFRCKRRVKKMFPSNINSAFGEASIVAWNDLEAKRFSPQDFLSFFQGALENCGIHQNIIAVLIGHKPQGVNFNYSEHDIQEFKAAFEKALPYLLPEQVEVEKLRRKSESEHKELSKLRKEY
jgi:hypothetical protein